MPERLLVSGIAGSGVLTGALEAAFPLRRILLLKGFVVSGSGLLLAADGRHTGLLVIQTFNDALGVFVLLVLRHDSHVSASIGDAAAAFLGPNERIPSSHDSNLQGVCRLLHGCLSGAHMVQNLRQVKEGGAS
jgi:hypothetical protein